MAGPEITGRPGRSAGARLLQRPDNPPAPRPIRLPSAGESEVCSRCRWGGRRRGQRAGPGVCQGPTHRSCALGIEPSRPLPAMPLLEHAASCEELLVGGHSKQTQAQWTLRAGQGGQDPPPDTSGGAGQRGAGARTRDLSPGPESSSRAPPAPQLPALGIPSR